MNNSKLFFPRNKQAPISNFLSTINDENNQMFTRSLERSFNYMSHINMYAQLFIINKISPKIKPKTFDQIVREIIPGNWVPATFVDASNILDPIYAPKHNQLVPALLELHMSPKWIAAALGISESAVSKYKANPSKFVYYNYVFWNMSGSEIPFPKPRRKDGKERKSDYVPQPAQAIRDFRSERFGE